MIDPFLCVRCNAALVVVDAPSVECRYCGAVNEVPAAYREELRLTRALDQTTRRAVEEWARLDRIKVPRWWFVTAVSIPFLVLAGGLAMRPAGTRGWYDHSSEPVNFIVPLAVTLMFVAIEVIVFRG
jgi:hypothetical protein